MKIFFPAFLSLLFLVSCSDQTPDYASYVDPFIGTAYTGHIYPAATTPFGMVQVGPDSGTKDWEFCSGYHDSSSSIMGFSHTHLSGTGCPNWLMTVCRYVFLQHRDAPIWLRPARLERTSPVFGHDSV